MANARESELVYPWRDAVPEPGEVIELAAGLRWLRMGLPFALDHINLWLLRDRLGGLDGWTIVDCGIANDPTKAAWERIFATALDGLPVLRVLCTHMHPDHIGLAHWLTERWSVDSRECRLWISGNDWAAARLGSMTTTGHGGPAAMAFFASHGMHDPEALDKVRRRSNYYGTMVPAVPASFRRLLDGDRIRIGDADWTAIAGYGHAPEHIALHRAATGETPPLLISGDMVLPRISTNVSVLDLEPESDPLTLYLRSLERLRPLPADVLVLPAHGKPFSGLHARLDQLREHHDERLAEVHAACAEAPRSAFELLPVLFRRPLDLHQTTFAMGESIAHLHALWHAGRLQRRRGDDGIYRFTAMAVAA